MSTLSGYAQVSAEWAVESQFLHMLKIPLEGQIHAQMTGLISEIAMQITQDNEVEVHHCVAQIRDLRVGFEGSMAADVLHWFRQSITRAIRRTLEEVEYCAMMRNNWLPWVEAQLYQFPTNLTISNNPDVTLIQTMQSIAMTQNHVDIRMRSDLIWDKEFVESGMVEDATLASVENLPRSTRMIDMFIDEHTVQSIIAAAHFSGHLKTKIESPFLKTSCDVLCIGTVLPELAEQVPNRTLTVEATTLSPPVIDLQEGKALVYLNASLNVFAHPPLKTVEGSMLTINVETEFTVTMEMKNKRVKGYINMINAQANLVDSKVGLMSQKTIDFLVNMSTPFLEDAVDVLIGRGLIVADPFQFPSTNEHLSIHDKCLRWEADIVMPTVVAHTNIF
uniref:Lipid-binding serum glycoprotein C-terminal domain-containing protein n=1 Tax=Caenorhabditis japonica TaxID=281687 RepID=A0A8R1DHE3_CAEJA